MGKVFFKNRINEESLRKNLYNRARISAKKYDDDYTYQHRDKLIHKFNAYEPSYELFRCIDETFRTFGRKVGTAKVLPDLCTNDTIAIVYSCSFDMDKHKKYMDYIMYWYGYLFDREDDSVDYGSYIIYLYRKADSNELRLLYSRFASKLNNDEIISIVMPKAIQESYSYIDKELTGEATIKALINNSKDPGYLLGLIAICANKLSYLCEYHSDMDDMYDGWFTKTKNWASTVSGEAYNILRKK